MVRLQLTNDFWSRLRPILIQNNVYDKKNLRLTIEGILYKLRVGCPWRDVPNFFGNWNALYKRFNSWSFHGKLKDIFFAFKRS